MPEARGSLSLDPETSRVFRTGKWPASQDLQRDEAVECNLSGPVNHPHAAPGDFLEKFATAQQSRVRRRGPLRRIPGFDGQAQERIGIVVEQA
jgi:hypothetical protein